MKLALPRLAQQQVTPTSGVGLEAVVTRARFDAMQEKALRYFAPVADTPGFPRAAARTLDELQMAEVPGASARRRWTTRGRIWRRCSSVCSGRRARPERCRARDCGRPRPRGSPTTPASSWAAPWCSSTWRWRRAPRSGSWPRSSTDVATATMTVPAGDRRTLAAVNRLGYPVTVVDAERATEPDAPKRRGARKSATPTPPRALTRLQQHLFSTDNPPAGEVDESVSLFSAPGEGREAIEMARRVMAEADRGVPFDEMAILLRAPHTYFGLLEHALARAGVPAWFERGTRRPDPAGRAFLALLACADEQLSARRFAEYLSLGQVPTSALHAPAAGVPSAGDADRWTPPTDDLSAGLIRDDDRAEDPPPEAEAPSATERDGNRIVAGTLRAPWRWEELLVEAYVIKGLRSLAAASARACPRVRPARARAARRGRGLAARGRDPPRSRRADAPRGLRAADRRRAGSLARAAAVGRVAAGVRGLAPRVLRQPARVLRVLRRWRRSAAIGPVSLDEARDVLTPRLLTLTHEPAAPPLRARLRRHPGLGARPRVPRRVRARPRRAHVPAAAARGSAAARPPAHAASTRGWPSPTRARTTSGCCCASRSARRPSACTCRTRASRSASRGRACRRSTCST